MNLDDRSSENVSMIGGKTSALARYLLLLFVCCLPGLCLGQSQTGTLLGNVADQNGAAVPAANVRLMNRLTGYRAEIAAGPDGTFAFHNVPFADYELSVSSTGFGDYKNSVAVRSNVPIRINVGLAVGGAAAEVTVDYLASKDKTQTETQISAERIQNFPTASRTRGLPGVVATTSGITTQNGGLMHVRGVDDGILYVVDGVPITDRVDLMTASGSDIGDVRSIQVITGNFPVSRLAARSEFSC